LRDKAAQHATFPRKKITGLFFVAPPAFAGDHQHMTLAPCCTAKQKVFQCAVCLTLTHTMQIDAGIDEIAFTDLTTQTFIKRCDGGGGLRVFAVWWELMTPALRVFLLQIFF
jgi:hypothetical protein